MNHIAKMNEAIVTNNRFTMDAGGKRIVCPFRSQEFWKCIDYVLSEVTYGKKGHNIWSDRAEPTKLRRDVCGNNDLYKVCCDHYCHFYIYACH